MNQLLHRQAPERLASVYLQGVDWRTYSRLLRAFGEFPAIRLTYDRGELEIMSPLLEHDDDARFLGYLVLVLTEEMALPLKSGGSTTLRRRLAKKGIEADECFWIANAHRLAGKRRLDLSTDPPPDLALEVDVTQSSMDRFDIYAALKVQEIWRLDGDELSFYVLGPQGKYTKTTHSRNFSIVTGADLLVFLKKARKAGDIHPTLREFRAWVRRRKNHKN